MFKVDWSKWERVRQASVNVLTAGEEKELDAGELERLNARIAEAENAGRWAEAYIRDARERFAKRTKAG